MSPNKNMDSVTPREQSTEKTEKKFSPKQKLLASVALGAALVIGAHNLPSPDKSPFPDNYRAVPSAEEASVMEAPNAVDPSKALAAEQEPVVEKLKGPYVEASSAVVDPNNDAYLKEHWNNFEKKHANDPEPVADVTNANTTTAPGYPAK